MSSEVVPPDPSSWSEVLERFNIPKLVAGPAGEAISRLVGHAVDIPAEYVKNIKQGIQDKREARSEVSKALAKAAATEVVADKELVRRAAQSFLAKELRSQANKEAVTAKAIEHLSEAKDESDAKAQSPSDDWLNVFERHAENASSEKMRDLWGRVLAKEIRSPRTFSLRTLRFVSELEGEVASIFQKYRNGVMLDGFILKPDNLSGPTFLELMRLEEAGLLTGVDGNIGQTYELKEDNPRMAIELPLNGAFIDFEKATHVRLDVIKLTDIAQQLLTIVPVDESLEKFFLQDFINRFPKENVSQIRYARLDTVRKGVIPPMVVSWVKTEPTAT